ncbi:hypothetical protein IF1G_00874 [Cordyceps javanica]|uniref:Uncharacterized protein n=1 Tax=Cordyceps javanica TaxID=43265 RepID=A0A545VGU8_9HYPO|nr:hypothetical protein IF1G_00874 [Cordyceps javanica]TQW12113.1 hypothetical protein IF2G_00844 [Cordyceps javanica]
MGSSYPTAPQPIDSDPYQDIKDFIQIYDTNNLTVISNDDFFSAPFREYCPSGDCMKDCQNMTRVFASLPGGVQSDARTYGRPRSKNAVSLFGVCTNLDHITEVLPTYKHMDKARGFFSVNPSAKTNISRVTSKVASCYASTCDLTREPDKCKEACAIDNFLAQPTRLNFNLQNNNTGAMACISRLCDNTCGLPYANQDVLGIGVLTTYYVQALALLVIATTFLASAGYQLWVSVAVATFAMHPASVDALNGYALLASSIMGFVPPIFTLMLLHSHGVKSWFSTGVVLGSWAINSVTFFILVSNLSSIKGDSNLLGVGLQSLFHTTSCGGSSAMALCHQLTGAEPLVYLDQFFNKNPIPNIKNVPVLWAFATAVLLVTVGRQAFQSWKGKDEEVVEATHKPGLTALADSMRTKRRASAFFNRKAVRFGMTLLTTTIFCLALGYEFRVVREYQKMDIIDKRGWSFGQVVAVLFWVPPLLDTAHALFQSAHTDASAVNGETGKMRQESRQGVRRGDAELAQLWAAPNRSTGYTSFSPNGADSWNDGENLLTSAHVRPATDASTSRAISRRPVPYHHIGDPEQNEQV